MKKSYGKRELKKKILTADVIFGSHKDLGNIAKITFPNKSKIYLTNSGITAVLPKGKKSNEITISIPEMEIVYKALKMMKRTIKRVKACHIKD